jgi:hypothetical protein
LSGLLLEWITGWNAIAMYNNGLITLPELAKAMGNLDFSNAAGLIDTQSGLRLK